MWKNRARWGGTYFLCPVSLPGVQKGPRGLILGALGPQIRLAPFGKKVLGAPVAHVKGPHWRRQVAPPCLGRSRGSFWGPRGRFESLRGRSDEVFFHLAEGAPLVIGMPSATF